VFFAQTNFIPLPSADSPIPAPVSAQVTLASSGSTSTFNAVNLSYGYFSFPFASSPVWYVLPYIEFGSTGRLLSPQTDEYLFLSRGSILTMPDGTATPIETPPRNWFSNYSIIHIDAVSGRAKLMQPEINL
jgi:hypothetical protein